MEIFTSLSSELASMTKELDLEGSGVCFKVTHNYPRDLYRIAGDAVKENPRASLEGIRGLGPATAHTLKHWL